MARLLEIRWNLPGPTGVPDAEGKKKGLNMPRIAIFAVIAGAVILAVQAGPASAKLCGVGVSTTPAGTPVVGEEVTITYYLTDIGAGDKTDDPDCAIGGDAEGEVEAGVRAFLADTELLSANMERVDPWEYQTIVTFPEPGNWELFFDFSYIRPETGLQRSQYRWNVEVAVLPSAMAAAGTGVDDLASGATSPFVYLLAAGGLAALVLGARARLNLS